MREPCAWCGGPIPERARRDAVCCSKSCRQARHRFGRLCVSRRRATAPLRLAYADPPYPGLAARYYADHPDYGGEVDHRELVERMAATYDGWALSTSSDALPDLLAMIQVGRNARSSSTDEAGMLTVICSPRSLRQRLRGGLILIVAEVSPGRSIAWWRTRGGDLVREAWPALC